jgi:uncharacterized damage-inducible protein DinB
MVVLLRRHNRTLSRARQLNAGSADASSALSVISWFVLTYNLRHTSDILGDSMTEIERILDQLQRAYEGNAWHGPSVKEALAGVSAGQAHARPLAGAHTIWELVQHIAVWETVGVRRLSGDRAQIAISTPEDWPPPNDTSEAAWEQAKAALDREHQALVKAISATLESRLDEPILEGMSTVYVTLHGIVQHDIYHAGQISLLKKAM